ncbi:3-oxoacid CoA-transferase subunit A [Ruminococcaceae bacterium OttesenSCG-928-D13]|nr:3-oxoacid CoA-transferase subunit A [Ruminococcaceae bacterium OttesenSCG-928-D13]
MAKIVTPKEAAAMIPEGASIMVGGFMGCGNAHKVIAELAKLGTKNLTLICNDGAMPNGPDGEDFYGVAKLIHNRQISKLIASHVGLNPEVAEQMNDGSMDVTLIPQGSLAEMIRAGGAGLGGVLTPTGYGTIVQEAWHVHSVVEIEGRNYLLEKPIRADFALICGYKVDRAGNVWYKGTMRNFNQVMATAADTVIAEPFHLVETGDILPEDVVTTGALVNYIATEEA